MVTFSMPGTDLLSQRNRSYISDRCCVADRIRNINGGCAGLDNGLQNFGQELMFGTNTIFAENSTSLLLAELTARLTPLTALRITSSRLILSFSRRWIGLVAIKVWIREFCAGSSASIVRSISRGMVRHNAAMVGPSISEATECTASKSPGDAAGKPAS